MSSAFKFLAIKIDEMTSPSDIFTISCKFAKALETERNELLKLAKQFAITADYFKGGWSSDANGINGFDNWSEIADKCNAIINEAEGK